MDLSQSKQPRPPSEAEQQKPPIGKRGRQVKPRQTTEPKISPLERVNQFPGHTLSAKAGKLFCKCCKDELSLIKGSVRTHVQSKAHAANMQKYHERTASNGEAKAFIEEHFLANPNESGGTVSIDNKLYRYRMVECFLKNGVPLEKIDGMRTMLEYAGKHTLTDSHNLKSFIPKIEAQARAATCTRRHRRAILEHLLRRHHSSR